MKEILSRLFRILAGWLVLTAVLLILSVLYRGISAAPYGVPPEWKSSLRHGIALLPSLLLLSGLAAVFYYRMELRGVATARQRGGNWIGAAIILGGLIFILPLSFPGREEGLRGSVPRLPDGTGSARIADQGSSFVAEVGNAAEEVQYLLVAKTGDLPRFHHLSSAMPEDIPSSESGRLFLYPPPLIRDVADDVALLIGYIHQLKAWGVLVYMAFLTALVLGFITAASFTALFRWPLLRLLLGVFIFRAFLSLLALFIRERNFVGELIFSLQSFEPLIPLFLLGIGLVFLSMGVFVFRLNRRDKKEETP